MRKDLPLSLFTSCSRSQHSTWSIVLTFVLNELRNKLLLLYCSLSLFSHILLDTGPRCPIVIIFLYFILQQNALLSIFSNSHWDYPSCNLSLDIKVKLISSSYQSYVHSIISDQLPLPFLLLHSFASITSLYPGMTVKPGSVPSIVDHYLLCHPFSS